MGGGGGGSEKRHNDATFLVVNIYKWRSPNTLPASLFYSYWILVNLILIQS